MEVVRISTRNLSAAAIRRVLHRPAPSADAAAGVLGGHVGGGFAAEQELRHRLERSPVLRLGKAVANRVLDRTGLGETITAVLRRPADRRR